MNISSMEPGQTLSMLFSKIVIQLDSYIKKISPDIILLHGDTLTTAAAALCAFYNKVEIAHVEAGLRTFDLRFPWPEEGNRKLVSAIASLHFAPTQKAFDNLVSEGVEKTKIFVTGNTAIDALFHARAKLRELDNSGLNPEIGKILKSECRSILVTCHRRENHGEGIRDLCDAIIELVALYDDLQFIIPLHPNPEVKGIFPERLSALKQVALIEPQDYLSFVYLMTNAHLILSDSGGVQEEAPSLGVPVLVLREKSERLEAVESGVVTLIGNSRENIVKKVSEILNDEKKPRLSIKDNPYGDGTACGQIRTILEEYFK